MHGSTTMGRLYVPDSPEPAALGELWGLPKPLPSNFKTSSGLLVGVGRTRASWLPAATH